MNITDETWLSVSRAAKIVQKSPKVIMQLINRKVLKSLNHEVIDRNGNVTVKYSIKYKWLKEIEPMEPKKIEYKSRDLFFFDDNSLHLTQI
jgi:hypothetical protein